MKKQVSKGQGLAVKDPRGVEQRAFESIEKVTDSQRTGLTHSILERLFNISGKRRADWVGDAEWAQIEQEPVRGRALIYSICLVVIALLIWASVAELDEVTRGEGRVIPSRQLQIVQSIDGGVIREIYVREGDIVEAGDLMFVLDKTRSMATYSENRNQALALQARIARLSGLIESMPFLLDLEVVQQIPDIAQREKEHYDESLAELRERQSVYREQHAQRVKELEEVEARLASARRSLRLAQREYDATLPLVSSGAVSEIDALRLERDISQIDGEISQAEARMGALAAAINESTSRIAESDISFRNAWRTDLSEALAQLRMLNESRSRLADMVESAEVRAPVNGIVQRVFYNTIGGVIPAGRETAEIVPLDDQLVIEARIVPADIAFLRPGLSAVVKISAYDFTVFGGLDATLEQISADTITDERDNTYYLVRVRTVQNDGIDAGMTIIPGMTAQVDIMTGKRTVLQYLLKPVLRATSNALSER